MSEIVKELIRIQRTLKAPKNQYNSFGKYKYRNCEDILEAVKPILGDCVLTLSDSVENVGDRYYVKAKACIETVDGSCREVSSYAREAVIKKGMDESQITGACSSYARKYALCGLFCLDDTKDADTKDNADDPGDYIVPIGESKGKPLKSIPREKLQNFVTMPEPSDPQMKSLRSMVERYLKS